MGYVIRTDALGEARYFAGADDAPFQPNIVITAYLMNAWFFSDRSEAEELVNEDLGSAWYISEVSHGVSGNLRKPAKPRPTFENDISLVSEYEYNDGWLLDTLGGRRTDYARIKAMKSRGVYDLIVKANEADWTARKAWTVAFGTKREQRQLGCEPTHKVAGNG